MSHNINRTTLRPANDGLVLQDGPYQIVISGHFGRALGREFRAACRADKQSGQDVGRITFLRFLLANLMLLLCISLVLYCMGIKVNVEWQYSYIDIRHVGTLPKFRALIVVVKKM
ncbi:uncharacterized protein SCHCODRAFT_02495703 [Schizophyllum commune H4-8]|nr:uncharacterized protein SCHCODRAFT_02495703 [Schizophyllum commune H4-8]KAI5895814.1 hypothetical protein SCHCODRAFT_02495703 [Schizophyllum commune H4-8]